MRTGADKPGQSLDAVLADLLARIAARDHRAYAQLCRQCRPRLASYATRYVSCHGTVDDVLQETFIAIWLAAGQYSRSVAAPMTWMMTILRNKAVDHLRADVQARRWQRESMAGTLDWHSAAEPPDLLVERLQSAQMLSRGLAVLNDTQRTAIELAFYQDLTCVDVASRMCIPLGTAKTLIRRGRIQLRAHLKHPAPHRIVNPPGDLHA